MIRIGDSLNIDERLIHETFVRASGPGGQNVNKVATAVELRFAAGEAGFASDFLHRLRALAGRQMNREGVIVVTAQQYRSQTRNREAALEKLVSLLKRASVRPRRRVATKPTKASKTRRLEHKVKHSRTKKLRQSHPEMD